MWQNTSVIPDENLAHRMGLIPLAVDPRLFEFKDPEGSYDENNSLRFKLHVKCTSKLQGRAPFNCTLEEEEKYFDHSNVYSGDLEWVPMGSQAERFKRNKPRPLHDDILIAKLRPGQEIEMEVICEKGLGKTHAKWSPVCTAYYRNLPDIKFTKPITGDDAKQLKQLCPMGVFDIEDLGSKGKQARLTCQANKLL